MNTETTPVTPHSLTEHKGNFLNDHIHIKTVGGRTAGGAFKGYQIDLEDLAYGVHLEGPPIQFQEGNPSDGINGISNEALLAIVADRLRGFDAGPFRTRENSLAITHLELVLFYLQKRTAERVARGVEGQQVK